MRELDENHHRGDSPTIAERWYRRGVELVRAGRYAEALEPLEQAMANSIGNRHAPYLATLRSYYGVALAFAKADTERGRHLCEESVYLQPRDPELYVNLARVFMRSQRKELALAAAETAITLRPDHKVAGQILQKLGQRKPPIFPFLSRSNPLNKYVGLIRHRLGSTGLDAR